MGKDWKHRVGGFVNRDGKTRAQLEALQAEQEAAAAEERRGDDKAGTNTNAMLGPLRPGNISKSGGSVRSSGSKTYDYTGMDEAAKVSQALQAAEGSFVGVAMEDPMKIPQLQNSIRSMQQYLSDYQSGRGLPPVRVKSENFSTGSSAPGGSMSFTRDDFGSQMRVKKAADEGDGAGEVNMVMPVEVQGGAPQDMRHQAAPGPDNQQLVNDDAFGIPPNVDVNFDPGQKPTDMLRRKTDSFDKPRAPEQGPPMPGLNHQSGLLASLLTQYV